MKTFLISILLFHSLSAVASKGGGGGISMGSIITSTMGNIFTALNVLDSIEGLKKKERENIERIRDIHKNPHHPMARKKKMFSDEVYEGENFPDKKSFTLILPSALFRKSGLKNLAANKIKDFSVSRFIRIVFHEYAQLADIEKSEDYHFTSPLIDRIVKYVNLSDLIPSGEYKEIHPKGLPKNIVPDFLYWSRPFVEYVKGDAIDQNHFACVQNLYEGWQSFTRQELFHTVTNELKLALPQFKEFEINYDLISRVKSKNLAMQVRLWIIPDHTIHNSSNNDPLYQESQLDFECQFDEVVVVEYIRNYYRSMQKNPRVKPVSFREQVSTVLNAQDQFQFYYSKKDQPNSRILLEGEKLINKSKKLRCFNSLVRNSYKVLTHPQIQKMYQDLKDEVGFENLSFTLELHELDKTYTYSHPASPAPQKEGTIQVVPANFPYNANIDVKISALFDSGEEKIIIENKYEYASINQECYWFEANPLRFHLNVVRNLRLKGAR